MTGFVSAAGIGGGDITKTDGAGVVSTTATTAIVTTLGATETTASTGMIAAGTVTSGLRLA